MGSTAGSGFSFVAALQTTGKFASELLWPGDSIGRNAEFINPNAAASIKIFDVLQIADERKCRLNLVPAKTEGRAIDEGCPLSGRQLLDAPEVIPPQLSAHRESRNLFPRQQLLG